MGTIRKRGGTYRAEVFRKGVRDSSTFETRQEAVDWVVTREAELLDGAVPASKQTVSQAIDHVKTMRTFSRSSTTRLEAIKRQKWAAIPLSTLTSTHLADWRNERVKTVKPATVRREMTELRSVLEVARTELKWISVNPIKDVKRPPKPPSRERLISDDERDAMVAAVGFDGVRVETIGHETAVAFLLALETAMRAGEILALKPADVDRKRKVARLHKSKTGPGRDVPLSTRALELFDVMSRKRLIRIRRPATDRIFHIDPDSLDATFRRARTKAGLSGFTYHDSRATALTRLATKLSPYELARMAGHSSLAMVMVYFREPASSIAERLG